MDVGSRRRDDSEAIANFLRAQSNEVRTKQTFEGGAAGMDNPTPAMLEILKRKQQVFYCYYFTFI